jgi:hypothetical protein
MIFYTNWLIPRAQASITLGAVSLIRPEFRGDAGLVAHELVHVRQWRESYGMFWPRYLLSRRYRRDYEVEAYREQLKFAPQSVDRFAGFLANNYYLGISVDVARSLLTA